MTRYEEVKKGQENLNLVLSMVTKSMKSEGMYADYDAINSLTLASILQTLSDISITLAIISDKLGGDAE